MEEKTAQDPERLLWDLLMKHAGHVVEIAIYGDPDDPADICLEDKDTSEVILDAEIYTLRGRNGIQCG